MTNDYSRESNAFSKSIMIIIDGNVLLLCFFHDVHEPVDVFPYISPFNETSMIIMDLMIIIATSLGHTYTDTYFDTAIYYSVLDI